MVGPMARWTPLQWPVFRQVTKGDLLGRGSAVTSRATENITPRTENGDRVGQSICPYCAVGCGEKNFGKDEKIIQLEGDPESPLPRGRLCPKGAASEELVNAAG